MNIAVCDSKAELQDALAQKIKSYLPEADICKCSSREELILGFLKPDIVFLGIQLTDEKIDDTIKQAMEMQSPSPRFMMVKSGGAHIRVEYKDIIFAEVLNRKIIIHTTDSDIEYYGKFSELEEKCGYGFFCSHRAFIVNLAHVQEFEAGLITMTKGTALVSKKKYKELVKSYEAFVGEG